MFRWLKKACSAIWNTMKKPWFIWTSVFLLLCLIIWFVGAYWEVTAPSSVRLTIILVLVILWSLNNIRLYRKNQNKPHDLKGHDIEFDPEQVALIASQMADAYNKAIKLLPTTSVWKPTKRLPWYLTLGLHGAGKSSSIRHSGLYFPEELNQQQNSEEEKFCDWRYSSEAVFLDTNGILSSHGQKPTLAKAIWFELLELIQLHRRRKIFDGVIISISAIELLNQSPEQRAAHAFALRSRLYELEQFMGVQCPIYVQLTKADLIKGFREFVELLSPDQRQQILGLTFSNEPKRNLIRNFGKKYATLIDNINQHIVCRLNVESDAKKAAAALQLPAELTGIQTVLQDFFNQLFEPNHYQEKAFLRGIYFVSNEQQGLPSDFVLQSKISQLGIKPLPAAASSRNTSLFLHQLYKNFILQEKNLFHLNKWQQKFLYIREGITAALVTAAVMLMMYYWGHSYQLNREQAKALYNDSQQYLTLISNTSDNDQFSELQQLYYIKHAFNAVTDPDSMHWGLYQGHKFEALIKPFYLRELNRKFLPQLQTTLETELSNTNTLPSDTFNFLRAYLMLAEPEHLDKQFIESWMEDYWESTYPTQVGTRQVLNRSLGDFLSYQFTPITLNTDLVQAARDRLKDISPSQQIFFQLQRMALGKYYHLGNAFDNNFIEIFGNSINNLKVSQLYTKQGYEEIYKADLTDLVDNVEDSNWILAKNSAAPLSADDKSAIKQRVETLYMKSFIDEWKTMLSQLQIAKFNNVSQVDNILPLLTDANSPLYQILQAIKDNTTLEKGDALPPADLAPGSPGAPPVNKQRLVSQATKGKSGITSLLRPSTLISSATKLAFTGQSLPTTNVGDYFYPIANVTRTSNGNKAAYEATQAALTTLSQYVDNIATASDPNQASFMAAVHHIQNAGGEDPLNKLIQLANKSPTPLNDWLNQIAANTWQAILNSAIVYINSQWQQNIYPQYSTLWARYPFTRSSTIDADTADVAAFLGKDGAFNEFFTKFLSPFINTQSTPWKINTIDGGTLPLQADTLRKLYQLVLLQKAFFASDGSQVNMTFNVENTDLDSDLFYANLEVGDQTYPARHGPQQAQQLSWPPSDQNNIAALQTSNLAGISNNIQFTGNWALFKLIDTGRMRESTINSDVYISFVVGGKNISYVIKSDNLFNPLNLSALRGMTLTQTL